MNSVNSNETNHPSFRLQAKHIFLTYPQYECDKRLLLQHLQGLYPIQRAIIARELHADGNPHMHCYIEFKKKISTTNQRRFDYDGKHPNVSKCGNVQATIQYCQKEDMDPLTYGIDNNDDEEIDNIYDLARTLEEENFFNTCRKKKVIIHPSLIDKFHVRKSCMAEDTERQGRFTDNNVRNDIQWDHTLACAARAAIARGDQVNMDYGSKWYWKDNLGQEYQYQTVTIRDAYGRSCTLQACLPQVNLT